MRLSEIFDNLISDYTLSVNLALSNGAYDAVRRKISSEGGLHAGDLYVLLCLYAGIHTEQRSSFSYRALVNFANPRADGCVPHCAVAVSGAKLPNTAAYSLTRVASV